MKDSEFAETQRVYYEHTDHGKVVYHADYLKFLERARTEWLRSRGVDQSRLQHEDGILFVVRRLDIRYHKPARFDDLLQVGVQVLRIGRASMRLAQRIFRSDVLLCTAEVEVACVDDERMKPCSIPTYLTRKLLHGN